MRVIGAKLILTLFLGGVLPAWAAENPAAAPVDIGAAGPAPAAGHDRPAPSEQTPSPPTGATETPNAAQQRRTRDAAEPPTREAICAAIGSAAAENSIPFEFFTRLIWQESRFNPRAVSRKGAQGVAQFMPGTALWRGLADPFDPFAALPHSAALLRDLRNEFGNLGLAAAAYNAGAGRVQAWLAGRAGLPAETRAYVRIVTGRSAESWRSGGEEEAIPLPAIPCDKVAVALASRPATPAKPRSPWGVQVAGNWSESVALASFAALQKHYPALLGGREPLVIRSRGAGRGPAVFTRIRVGAETRIGAEKLCSGLRSAGGNCLVLRN
jgi:Transglycosylase SLT domain